MPRLWIIDRDMLWEVQDSNDVVKAQEIMQDAFRTDVRPLLAEARLQLEAALDPLGVYRSLEVRNQLTQRTRLKTVSTGL
jgi:L-rhamnose isomerase/sugar isomerase